MGRKGKPTLGYPSRQEAVASLYKQGLSVGGIAEAIGVTPKIVQKHLFKVKRDYRWKELRDTRTVILPKDLIEELETEAQERNISVHQFIGELLETILDEDLFKAILDDVDD